MLFTYLKQVEGFCRDRAQKRLNPEDLIMYVNMARREIAMRTQCIRKIPPISGSIEEIIVTAPGSGYSTTPTVTISGPDLPAGQKLFPGGAQATATAQVVGGQIAGVTVNFGGSGYFQPSVTITDTTGTGAEAFATVPGINVFVANQEEYFLSDINVSSFPGVASVFATLSHYVIFSNIRYRIAQYPLTDYKSFIENYPFQYYFVPVACAQKEQGAAGSFLFYPIPSQQYAWEPDCLCLPSDMTDDDSTEAIPQPWTDAVSLMATAMAMEELQQYNSARYFWDRYNQFATRYSIYTRPRTLISNYGRK